MHNDCSCATENTTCMQGMYTYWVVLVCLCSLWNILRDGVYIISQWSADNAVCVLIIILCVWLLVLAERVIKKKAMLMGQYELRTLERCESLLIFSKERAQCL